ncbi:MAG: exosortase/archaeosortase family protein, partial [Candidatus Bathyarchaeia archaeon]
FRIGDWIIALSHVSAYQASAARAIIDLGAHVAVVAGQKNESLTYQHLLVVSAVTFLVLPFVITFNEFLTKIVESIGFYMFIQNAIVPSLVRMAGAILQYLFGIQTSVSSSSIYLQGTGLPIEISMSWNCVGWQSLVLFIFTLVTGLQGPYTLRSKVKCLILGAEGTFLVNLLRIVLSCLLAFHFGYLPAVIFHDYLGTLLLIVWLGIFWYFSLDVFLERKGVPTARRTRVPFRLSIFLQSLRFLPREVWAKVQGKGKNLKGKSKYGKILHHKGQ